MTDDRAVPVTLELHEPDAARLMTEDMADLWEAVYADRTDDPFASREQFLGRLARYRAAPGYTLITAHEHDRLVGFAYGYPLPNGSRWWDGIIPEPAEGFTVETGDRTFAVNDIVVSADRRRRGIARAMHERLRAEWPNARLTLAVEPGNSAAQAIYRKWGYRLVGRVPPPFPDAPALDLMILEPE